MKMLRELYAKYKDYMIVDAVMYLILFLLPLLLILIFG